MEQKITEHFNLGEFTRSAVATTNNIVNSLNPDKARDRKVIEYLQNLCIQVLETLREFIDAPVVISSGYRCPELNKLAGGVWNSQHLTGEAIDIVISDEHTFSSRSAHVKLRRMYGEIRRLYGESTSQSEGRYF